MHNRNKYFTLAAMAVLFSNTSFATDCNNIFGEWISDTGARLYVTSHNQNSGYIEISYKVEPSLYPETTDYGFGYAVVPDVKESSNNHTISTATTVAFIIKWPDNRISTYNGTCRNLNNQPSLKLLYQKVDPNAENFLMHTYAGSKDFKPKSI